LWGIPEYRRGDRGDSGYDERSLRPFQYERAHDAAGAVALLAAKPAAKLLAGGTNLVDLMRLGVETPDALVDIRRLSLNQITRREDGGLRLGATVPNSELAADPNVRASYPAIAQAVLAGASGQLRNVATTAGNLLQRTRCVYFQDASQPCNKRDPGSGCPAREGEHRNLAVIGYSEHCVATHPSDLAVALAAFDAVVRVIGPEGEREIPLTEFHRLPGDMPQCDTLLDRRELIVAVDVPPLSFSAHSSYVKVRERASFSFALVSVAVAIDVADGVVRDARIAFGGLAHKPWRAFAAEEALRGSAAGADNFERAAEAALAGAEPLRDNGYKVALARRTLVRALLDLAE
jgi:xanthine dehydrogenase YagS FAD-binding subunit